MPPNEDQNASSVLKLAYARPRAVRQISAVAVMVLIISVLSCPIVPRLIVTGNCAASIYSRFGVGVLEFLYTYAFPSLAVMLDLAASFWVTRRKLRGEGLVLGAICVALFWMLLLFVLSRMPSLFPVPYNP